MAHIKEQLKDLIVATMLPEVEAYIDDLHKLIEEKKHTEDDILAVKEMESFLVELHNVLEVIEQNSVEDSEYQRIYDHIMASLNHEHEED